MLSMDILERIDQWGTLAPERPAHISEQRVLTYGELCRQSDVLAGQLAQALPADGAPVAVLGHKQPEMLIAFLGCVKAGHPYIPLDTSLPAQRIERIIATANVQLVLTPERVAELVKTLVAPSAQRVMLPDPYYIIFTSGSTGEPKGVVITLACLTSFVQWMVDEQHFQGQGEVFLNQAPFSFDLSVMDLYLAGNGRDAVQYHSRPDRQPQTALSSAGDVQGDDLGFHAFVCPDVSGGKEFQGRYAAPGAAFSVLW